MTRYALENNVYYDTDAQRYYFFLIVANKWTLF